MRFPTLRLLPLIASALIVAPACYDVPLTDKPPVEKPPANKPPVVKPPVEKPPIENPTDGVNPIPKDPIAENPAPIDPGVTSGGSLDPDNVFEHPELMADPFEVLSRNAEQGTPETASRQHSCQKPRYETIRSVLSALRVEIGSDAMLSAGRLFRDAPGPLGAPNYKARIPEGIEWTTSGATKAFDIFVQAAPEIIERMPENEHCMLNGQPTAMFDEQGNCNILGISCLQGTRTTQAQKELCDAAVLEGSTPEKGRAIAVAAILAAAYTCE